MKVIGVQCRVSLFLIAAVLLLQFSPGLAAGQPDAQQATIQGSRFPGMPVPSTETKRDRRHGPVEVIFTKWGTAALPPSGVQTRSLFKGFVGGYLGDGDFVAEVLGRQASTPCTALAPPCMPEIPVTGPVAMLEAIYEVRAGEHSFIALIQGGSNSAGGRLEGVIVSGWRIGAHVRVGFQTYAPLPTGPGCPDNRAPADRNCFVGTIRVERAP
jgi:hypothetical protein